MGFWVRFNWNLTYICSMVNNCCSNHSMLTSVRKKLVLFLQEKPYWKKNSINLYWSFLDADYPTDSIRYPTLNWLRVQTIRSYLTIVRALYYTYLSTYQVESQVSTLVAGDFMALQVITPSNRKVTLCSKYLRFGWKCFQDSIGFCNDCNITDCS